jgi:TnpA family transposase
VKTQQRTFWNVTFSDTYATITTTVAAIGADDAVVLAENLIRDYYDIDVSRWMTDTDDTTEPASGEGWA